MTLNLKELKEKWLRNLGCPNKQEEDKTANWIVVDFETTNVDFGNPQLEENCLVCSAGFDSDGNWYDSIADIIDQLRAGRVLIAHHAKFEIGWLRREGYDVQPGESFCTQIAQFVIQGNRRLSLNLGSVARRYGVIGKHDFVSALIGGGVCPSRIPSAFLREYNRGDIRACLGVFLAQIKLLSELELWNVAFCRNLVTPILQEIEIEGTCLDPKLVEEQYLETSKNYELAKFNLDSFTGGINENSNKQLSEYIYNNLGFREPTLSSGKPLTTGAGKPSTSREAISLLKGETPEQKKFLKLYGEIGSLKKEREILTKMRECCKNDGGLLYGSYNQTVAKTHRLTSSGRKYKLQFHNFPRAFKRLFCAKRTGHKIFEADAPQLEFRIAGELGRDRHVLRDVANAVDIHQLSFEIISPKGGRQGAKKYTFRPLYGGSSGSSKEKKYYKAFVERYNGVYETQRAWTHEVVRTGKLRTATGLIFYWPDTRVTESGWITNTTSIFNYPIQMLATADIIPLVLYLVRLGVQSAGIPVALVNTVHDSLILECPNEHSTSLRQILVDCFTKEVYSAVLDVYGINIRMPLGVGIKIGDNWGEGIEEKFENKDKIEQAIKFIKENTNKNDDNWYSEGDFRQRVSG